MWNIKKFWFSSVFLQAYKKENQMFMIMHIKFRM